MFINFQPIVTLRALKRTIFSLLVTCAFIPCAILLGIEGSETQMSDLFIKEEEWAKDGSERHANILMVNFVNSECEIMKWAKKGLDQSKCLMIMLSSNATPVKHLSEKSIKRLQSEVFILRSTSEVIRNSFRIPIEDGENSSIVLACPMEISKEGELVIHWLVLDDKPEILEKVMTYRESLKMFFLNLVNAPKEVSKQQSNTDFDSKK
ncbi:hypothetical protein [Candidatus Similichlamydia epinepheli]|uniref:hypothetical protein n=1 Tax=Candidatus Similichlamydia epinepheli TaxID=1903953 RepID=UPI000D338A25|nr:hypothetical protein [Candidatus Similichlamydia epinepheli]